MRDELERRMAEFLNAQEKKRAAEEERRLIKRYGRAGVADLKADQLERRMLRRYGREYVEAWKRRSQEQFEWWENYKKTRGIT
jgi:hypothetical protein